MLIRENISLQRFNTFGIKADTRYYALIEDESQLALPLLKDILCNVPLLILGGGSNVLFVNDFSGLTLHVRLKGISIEKETPDHTYVRAMAGENWEQFVEYCVKNGWGGLENLTLIPGNVGTSPIQNIGAYGVELRDHFYSLEAYEMETGRVHTFYADDCSFGYRDSFFKKEGKGKFIILSVTFRLTTRNHQIVTHYGAIQQQLVQMQIQKPGIADVMNAVQQIRRSKLPDPDKLGNAGSFFKNPLIEPARFDKLLATFPDIPYYTDPTGNVKIAAGWLIEAAGWKGFREGDAGVHEKQALVLVNFGNAEGKQIFQLAQRIRQSVWYQFGITLEPEVNLIGESW